MFGLLVLGFVVLACWLSLSLLGLVFKLVFGLIGGIFGVLGGFLGLLICGIVGLALLPVVGLLMLPLMLPALFFGALVWLLLRRPRQPVIIAAR